jgi:DNA-directed RNA polymerase specialized sigma24 family protein
MEMRRESQLRYCVQITGDSWEAEDLRQEVLLKLYKAVENQPSREITNAYMYRIALNAWRDKKRKQGATRLEALEAAGPDRGEPDMRLEARGFWRRWLFGCPLARETGEKLRQSNRSSMR